MYVVLLSVHDFFWYSQTTRPQLQYAFHVTWACQHLQLSLTRIAPCSSIRPSRPKSYHDINGQVLNSSVSRHWVSKFKICAVSRHASDICLHLLELSCGSHKPPPHVVNMWTMIGSWKVQPATMLRASPLKVCLLLAYVLCELYRSLAWARKWRTTR